MSDCTYCGCDVDAHDPVVVYDREPAADGGNVTAASETLAGEFCNWGCLNAYIDDSDVATGTSCNWTPDA